MAVVVDPSLPYDRELAKGVAQDAREAGDWRLYVEEEQGRRLPELDVWPGQGIIASFDDDAVARQVMAAGLPTVAVGGGGGGFDAASGIPYVDTDNERIAAVAAEHLIERAIPHFGFYGLAPARVTVWSDARCRAFAPRAGFRSLTYMTTLFRRRFDVTPAALRVASRGRPSRTTPP